MKNGTSTIRAARANRWKEIISATRTRWLGGGGYQQDRAHAERDYDRWPAVTAAAMAKATTVRMRMRRRQCSQPCTTAIESGRLVKAVKESNGGIGLRTVNTIATPTTVGYGSSGTGNYARLRRQRR